MLKVHRNYDPQTVPPPEASLLIAFYNNFPFLEKVLASCEAQTVKNFEVILCDDGSRPDIVELVQQYQTRTRLQIQHLWHEDKGFRKNRMLNHGIKNARAPYLIFIDGDCVLHPEFVSEHIRNKKTKTVLSGRRVDLTPEVSNLLTAEKIRTGFIQKNYWWIFLAILRLQHNNAPKGIYVKSPWARKLANQKPRGIVGCNFSVHKTDLEEINGFDTRYEAPGTGEDSDIEYRLTLNGVTIEPFTHIAVQYHLYHKLQKRPAVNDEIFKQVQAEKSARTKFGLQELESC